MLESDAFLIRERQRLDEADAALAEAKSQVLPRSKYVEPLPTRPRTPLTWRHWWWILLGLLVSANASAVLQGGRDFFFPRDSMRVAYLDDDDDVIAAADTETGSRSYLVTVSREDIQPLLTDNPASLGLANLALLAALTYVTRQRRLEMLKSRARRISVAREGDQALQ